MTTWERLTSETRTQGVISYTYDAADRRATMVVAGQPALVYTYDPADRLAPELKFGLTYHRKGLAPVLYLHRAVRGPGPNTAPTLLLA